MGIDERNGQDHRNDDYLYVVRTLAAGMVRFPIHDETLGPPERFGLPPDGRRPDEFGPEAGRLPNDPQVKRVLREGRWSRCESVRRPHGLTPAVGITFLKSRLTGDTLRVMESVTVRDLRNKGGDVLDRVQRGETVVVTRDGRAIAELRPLPRPSVRSAKLIERRKRLPHVDPDALRRDIDAVINPSL